MFSYWLLWIGGGVAGAAGLCLLYWSMLGDRSRGRMRCPKCWYDMRGAASDPPYRCPECGNPIKRRRRLFKTRRRWQWAIVSAIILLISAALLLAPKVHKDGWLSITPSTVLILLFEYADPNAVFDELGERIYRSIDSPEGILIEDALWDWQWRWPAPRKLNHWL